MRIRLATRKDIPFVRTLAEASLVYGIPPTRDIPPEDVQAMVRRTYADLEQTFDKTKNFLIVVAEDEARQVVGYIMLDFGMIEPSTGEPQTFITDLAVARDHWGRGTTQALVKKASELAAARGHKYLVGHVSANNTRTLKIAQETLDFVVERYQIVRRCP